MSQRDADFDRWVESCFDPPTTSDDADEERPSSVELAENLARLFENPEFLARRYDREQIAKAIWFICSAGSGYFWIAREAEVPIELQVRWVSALKMFYSDLLDRICNRDGTQPDKDLTDTDAIDGAVYMIWDMDCLEGAAMFPGYEHLVVPIFSVLEFVLTLRTSSCIKSALHGLGHLEPYHPAIVHRIIDDFLRRSRQKPKWIREYAASAREGAVQ